MRTVKGDEVRPDPAEEQATMGLEVHRLSSEAVSRLDPEPWKRLLAASLLAWGSRRSGGPGH